MKYADGDVYEGNWKNDEFHGFGTLTQPDGEISSGNWKEGKLHGLGKIQFADGYVY
jgi:hypothetical protein